VTDEELDAPVWAALTGPHRAFAVRHGAAARYDSDVAPFAALEDAADPQAWRDLVVLAGGSTVALFGTPPALLPADWRVVTHLPALQMVETARLVPADGSGFLRLDASDVEDMLDLVARTRPGPFLRRTVELGGYLGARAEGAAGALVAMGGQRLATGAWREVSAVCTDPAHRGRGYARRVMEGVVAGIRAREERAFLHVTLQNPAIVLYEAIGFEVRREIDILVVRTAA
jgi:ribosomal protein S18 acetylase RimI-like enzyme